MSGRIASCVCVLALMVGCSHTAVDQKRDPPITANHDVERVERVRQPLPPSRYGNPKRYEVFGRHYEVLGTSEGFRERGMASWYGPKFHGRRTSSGETYDMYRMTAAHKHLPLPTYVEVVNVENDRRIVVLVNDRGPFAKGRIIDLSFAAARELDIVEQGTAEVEIRVLPPYQYLPRHPGYGRHLLASTARVSETTNARKAELNEHTTPVRRSLARSRQATATPSLAASASPRAPRISGLE